MPTKTVLEHVHGEVLRDGKESCGVGLKLTVNDIYVDELPTPVRREIQLIELDGIQSAIEDGQCTVRFHFGGRQYDERRRIKRGRLIAG